MSSGASSLVRETAPLGFQWPTIDPFLFCVHHLDTYPVGEPTFGPDPTLLAGRELGMDFEPRDGWRMYHGEVVPGFPAHPHRGFETVTYARQGFIDHSDSLGARARFGRGDVQWMTAGRGVVHAEMFPLLDQGAPNPAELFQIWMNLPAADKLVDPHFTMLWSDDLVHVTTGPEGRQAHLTAIAGAYGDAVPPPPPPHSWAARPDSDVAIWHVVLEPGADFELPARPDPRTVRALYVFEGGVLVGSAPIEAATVALLADSVAIPLTGGPAGAECLLLQGCPIGEPVAQQGPFVMNSREEIVEAFEDYRATQFGGWPWGRLDPVHGPDARRFVDLGGVERP